MIKEQILKEFDDSFNWEEIFGKNSKAQQSVRELFIKAISQTREETLAIPYNVSEWKRIGQERKYWDYFKQDIREETISEVEEMLPDEFDITENEALTLLNKIKQSLNKLKN